MAVWVRLKTIQYIEQHGVNVTKYPGDWVQVNKRLASLWITQGGAEIPGDGELGEMYKGKAGCVVNGDKYAAIGTLGPYQQDIEIVYGDPAIKFERAMIWDTSLPFRRQLLPVGLMLLDRWELCVPLRDYDQLAMSVGSQEDQEAAKAVIRDLRVPVYESRLIFAKDTPATRRLLGIWAYYRDDERINTDLAFLMALYKVKPLVLALPITWINNDARI